MSVWILQLGDRSVILVDMLCQLLWVVLEDLCMDLACGAGRWESSLVVAVTLLAFVLVESGNFGILHVLWNSVFIPALVEGFMWWV